MSAPKKTPMDGFKVNTCTPLGSTGIDAVHEILPMIHGIAELCEAGFRKESNGKSLFDAYNPELVASVFGGIGYLSALAMYHADEL